MSLPTDHPFLKLPVIAFAKVHPRIGERIGENLSNFRNWQSPVSPAKTYPIHPNPRKAARDAALEHAWQEAEQRKERRYVA